MAERVVPIAELESKVNKNIAAICNFGFISEAGHTNHCAHFVAHLLNLKIGAKCAPGGVSIRVNEIYNRCSQRGAFGNLPSPVNYCLIFATQSSNMAQNGTMMNGPRKHMGIYADPNVYDYSTMNHKVLRETVAEFQARLEGVYNAGGTNPVLLFYGYGLPV
jgi:hypothetical protein